MYIHFANQFMKEIQHFNRQDLVKYFEFFKKGWTFHGKGKEAFVDILHTYSVGLWYTLSGENLPSLTFIGSSNFGIYNYHQKANVMQ